jgi:PKD repeat protein
MVGFHWYFGDGTYDTAKNPVHTYPASGTYRVTLYLEDSTSTGRCSDYYSGDSINVTGACNAAFSFDNTNGMEVTLQPTYQSSSYRWNFGDGNYSTNGYVKHTYASPGTYTVCLKVDETACVDSVCKSITVSNTTGNSLQGFIGLQDTTILADTGVVYLIYYDPTDSSLTAVDTVMFDNDTSDHASYKFTNVRKGYYLVKAALIKSSVYYKQYLPTYAYGVRKWKDAAMIYVQGNSYVSFSLLKGKNNGGKGFVGGKVTQGANKKEGDPLEDIEVMLINKATQETAAYTYSDVNGDFSFTDIALGTYEIYTEVTGLATVPATVSLTEANPGVSNVVVRVSSSGVTTSIAFKGGEIFAVQPKLYPNPVKNALYLSLDIKKGCEGNLQILDFSGRVLMTKNAALQPGKQTLEVSTQNLPAGIYLLLLEAPGGAGAQYRFVKL